MKIVSWDGHAEINDGTNCTAFFVRDYGLPILEALTSPRHNAAPIVSGVKFPQDFMLPVVQIVIENTTAVTTYRRYLHQWFDGKNGQSRPLVVSDDNGANQRQMYALPLGLVQVEGGAGLIFNALLKPDGKADPHFRWRAVTESTDTWSVTTSGSTRVINNGGEDDAYPVLSLTPTTAKSVGSAYKRWVPIKWNGEAGSAQYPVDITGGGLDTAALVTAGKMQASGVDLAVEVDGSIVGRWLGGMNTATTKIWVPLSFQVMPAVELAVSLTAGAVTSIEVDGDITTYPSAGIIMIGTEAIQYTGKSNNKSQFVGITRGAHGTTAAIHSSGVQVDAIQHSVYILYGGGSGVRLTTSPSAQPIFSLTASTNSSWVFTEFGETAASRLGAWQYEVDPSSGFYAFPYSTGGLVTKTLLSPWDYLGIAYLELASTASTANIIFENVCGIDTVDITAGELYADDPDELMTWDLTHYGYVDGIAETADTTAVPGTRNSLTSWTQTIDLTGLTDTATRYMFSLRLTGFPGTPVESGFKSFAAINSATVALANGPTVTVNAERTNYEIDATITNTTTGDAITVAFNMQLNETLEIDTDQSVVVFLGDGSSQGQAVRRVGDPRQFWLPLSPGSNTLRYDDTGTGNVTVEIAFRKRYYI